MGQRASRRLLELLTLGLAALIALHAPGFGDYPFDAGPALTAIAHGSVSGFFSHQPVMGPFALYLRAPFAAFAAAIGDGPVGLYRWGDLACLLAVAGAAIGLARFARRRMPSDVRDGWPALLTQILIAGVCLLNPLVDNALRFGHPEELLTASLVVGALLAAAERRSFRTAVLLGLAVASKQWALLIVAPVILTLERDRIRALLISGGVAIGATLPMLIANPTAFAHALHEAAVAPSVVTNMSWLYPSSPSGLVRLTYIFGDSRVIEAHRLVGIEGMARPLITLLGVGIPLLVWRSCGRRLSVEQMLLTVALVFVLRCALDPGSVPYYHYPIVVVLLALDVTAGRRIPVAGLAATAISFIVFDRLWGYVSSGALNAVYIGVTLTACGLLIRELRDTTAPARKTRVGVVGVSSLL